VQLWQGNSGIGSDFQEVISGQGGFILFWVRGFIFVKHKHEGGADLFSVFPANPVVKQVLGQFCG
jgi:hypothetical protein